MLQRGSGHIVNTVSMGGITPLKGGAAYVASKFGLRGFLSALYSELKPLGIKVSGIYPSGVDTAMLRYEATHGGSLLNFVSTPQTSADVLKAFNRALSGGKLEVYVPYSDSLLARAIALFPSLLDRLYPVLEWFGRRGLSKYLKSIEKNSP
jgi:short-subunit dehydrogenase